MLCIKLNSMQSYRNIVSIEKRASRNLKFRKIHDAETALNKSVEFISTNLISKERI